MDLDAGRAYNNAPDAIKRLIDKVKARKKAVGETETNQLSAKLDELIQFSTSGWNVRKDADLVDRQNHSVGSKYSSQKAPGVGAFLNRNLGKTVLPAGYALAGSAFGRGVLPHIKGATPAGAAIGAVLGASVGTVVDRNRKRIAVAKEAQPRIMQDYLKARGIREVSAMSSKLDELIEFAGFQRTKKLLGIGAIGIGAGAAGIGAYHIIDRLHKEREWRKNAKDHDRLKVTHDLYIDKHGAMYPKNHPGMKRKKVTELNAELDELIEFAINGKPVLKTTLRGVKSIGNSPLGLGIRKKQNNLLAYRRVISHIEDAGKMMENYKFIAGKLDDLIKFEGDPRPRNELGMFTGEEGGPDPNAMVKTYRIAPNAQGMSPNKHAGVLGASALTVLGGAGGALGGKMGGAAWDRLSRAAKNFKKR